MNNTKQSSAVQLMFRVLIYIIGMFCIAIGVTFAINSDLGVSPVNSLPYVISQISGIGIGTCVTVVFCSYIIIQIIILGKEFKIINLTQIIFSIIFGYFVDLAKWIMGDFVIPTYAGRLVMMAFSIFFIALGVMTYVDTDLVPMPMEGFTLAITHKFKNIPFHYMKIIVDCFVVTAGAILSLLFMHDIVGIREGTIISAIAVGKVIALLQKPLKPIIDRLCFRASENFLTEEQDVEYEQKH